MRFEKQKRELLDLYTHYEKADERNGSRLFFGPAHDLAAYAHNNIGRSPLHFLPSLFCMCLVVPVGIISVAALPISGPITIALNHTESNRKKPIRKLIEIIDKINKNSEEKLSELCKKNRNDYIEARAAIYACDSTSKEYNKLLYVLNNLDEHFDVSPELGSRFGQPEDTEQTETTFGAHGNPAINLSKYNLISQSTSKNSSGSSSLSSTKSISFQ